MISSVSCVSSSTRPPWLSMATSTAARRSHRTGRNLIRVLKATLKGPQRGSQRPTSLRPQTTKDIRRQRATTPDFHPRMGLPAGRSETSLDISRTVPTSLLTCGDGGEGPHLLVIALVEGSSRIVAGQQRCRVPFDNFV